MFHMRVPWIQFPNPKERPSSSSKDKQKVHHFSDENRTMFTSSSFQIVSLPFMLTINSLSQMEWTELIKAYWQRQSRPVSFLLQLDCAARRALSNKFDSMGMRQNNRQRRSMDLVFPWRILSTCRQTAERPTKNRRWERLKEHWIGCRKLELAWIYPFWPLVLRLSFRLRKMGWPKQYH